MRVLIVAKTHMKSMACVGGLDTESSHAVRLMRADGSPLPGDTPCNVGQYWELRAKECPSPEPPHVEDIWVSRGRPAGEEHEMSHFLLGKVHPWVGSPDKLFEELVRPTYTGHGYINRIMGVPTCSTGYWVPDKPLTCRWCEGKCYYSYPRNEGVRLVPYVGYEPPAEMIKPGTLVRVSLARWMRNSSDLEERCYLQISGWYS